MSDDLPLRQATLADVPALVNHRRRMFEDMDATEGRPSDRDALDHMAAAYTAHLCRHLPDGALRAWVVESGARVAASGAVSLFEWLPRPHDVTDRLAYLHSVYTEPEFRRRGLARRIVLAAVDACRAAGLRRLTLHASLAGRPLYESLGFVITNEMRLRLD